MLEDDKVQRARKKKLETNPITEKYQTQKLGKGAEHVARLTDKHAQFKNLDPFRVLVLDTDATPDDIKNRYKKMSVLCHPDKNGGSGRRPSPVVDKSTSTPLDAIAATRPRPSHFHAVDAVPAQARTRPRRPSRP